MTKFLAESTKTLGDFETLGGEGGALLNLMDEPNCVVPYCKMQSSLKAHSVEF